jgi:hypothetical protein
MARQKGFHLENNPKEQLKLDSLFLGVFFVSNVGERDGA